MTQTTTLKGRDKLPVGLIQSEHMIDVPKRLYADPLWKIPKPKAQNPSGMRRLFGQGRSSKASKDVDKNQVLPLDVSMWVRCSIAPQKPIGLLVRYNDKLGEHELLVEEEDNLSSLSVLLAGRIELPFVGWVDALSLHCSGMSKKHQLHMESWHVKRIEKAVQDSWA